MIKFIYEFIQYSLFITIVTAVMFAVISAKQFAFDQNWINNNSLGLDGIIIWLCLLMGLFLPIKWMFNRLFKKNSILKYM